MRGSTKRWMIGFDDHISNHEKVLLEFEERGAIEKNNKREGKPINILCFDGGGMRGYAYSVMLETMQTKSGKNLLDCFDLIGGTSVGGCAALVCNRAESIEAGQLLSRDVFDDIREQCFEGMKSRRNLTRLISKGSLLHEDKYILEILKKKFPNESLLNKNGIPAFVVTARKVEQKEDDEVKAEVEPFILRSYEYPTGYEDKSDTSKDIHAPLAESTSSVLLCEAMAATAAVPPLVDRVTVNCDGKQIKLCDGGVISNCPVLHAFDEANRLYPKRPIGVVLSLGFTNVLNEHISRAVDVMRMSSPNLHYQRIAPHEIMKSFKPVESDLTLIAIMESRVMDYMLSTPRVIHATDVTIERLVRSTPTPKRNTLPLKSQKVFQDMLNSKNFERRQSQRRASLITITPISEKNDDTVNDHSEENISSKSPLEQSLQSVAHAGDQNGAVTALGTTNVVSEVHCRAKSCLLC